MVSDHFTESDIFINPGDNSIKAGESYIYTYYFDYNLYKFFVLDSKHPIMYSETFEKEEKAYRKAMYEFKAADTTASGAEFSP